jgi:undecaprenyl-diphosphatase
MTPNNPKLEWPRCIATRLKSAWHQLTRPSRGGVRIGWARVVTVGLAFVVTVGLTMVLFDVRAIIAARDLPAGVIAFSREFTDFGKVGWFLVPLGALLIALCFAPANLPKPVQAVIAAIFARAGFIFLAIGLPYGINAILKQTIGRARPFVGGGADAYLYHPFSWGPAYASLPSNHATTVCAAAVAIGALFPRGRALMWAYAVLIMISRVVVVAHHPSDVLAGALVGTVGALVVRNYFAARRIVFGVTPDGAIETFANPSWRRIKAAIGARA